MKLTKYHLGYKDPKPEEKDFIQYVVKNRTDSEIKMRKVTTPEGEEPYNHTAYQEALEEWTRRNVEPEPEWKRLKEKEPPWSGDFILGYKWEKKPEGEISKQGYFSSRVNELFGDNKKEEAKKHVTTGGYTHWADKATYDKALSYYKQYQKIFDGWELIEKESDIKADCFLFRKKGLLVWTFKDEKAQISARRTDFSFYGSITPDLFRDLLKENGYEA